LAPVEASFAHRQIVTQPLSNDGIQERTRPRIQIRTPSPVVKDLKFFGEGGDKAAISDVANKLQEIVNNYDLNNTTTEPEAGIPKAFIYNRHTAFKDTLDGMQGKNKQTQSARHILKGAHEHNANNINHGVMCFVQNISVNGFGSSLGDGLLSSSLQKETTLLTEMAMLHTNYAQLAPDQQEQFKTAIKQYESFLKDDSRPEFLMTLHKEKKLKQPLNN
jgi:hypothetical protein